MEDLKAVITADILNSTQFAPRISHGWLEELVTLLTNHHELSWALPPEIYRGDSFQGVLANSENALKAAVLARVFLRSKQPNTIKPEKKIRMKNVFEERSEFVYGGKRIDLPSQAIETDIRVAIGIGTTARITDRPGTSDGEAFRLSGTLADKIKQQKARIGIALPKPTDSLSAILDVFETLIGNWSAPQCEIILGILTNQTAGDLADKLNISRSAVSQRLKASNWWAAENLIQTFPELIQHYTHQ